MKFNRLSLPTICSVCLVLAGIAIEVSPIHAQSLRRPPPALEIFAGYAGFVDDSTIPHTVFGGAGRVYLTQTLGVGPEFVYMRGPGSDRDLYLTGNVTWDMLRPLNDAPRRVTPFLVAGGGLFRHTERFGSGAEGAFTAGGGTRVRITDRVYGLADFRIGWEPHYRITGGIGVRLSK